MDTSTIAQHRLHNQHITQYRVHTPAEVVGWLGAIQGQDYSGAQWAIGLRLSGSTSIVIEQAIAEHAIVRTWLLRGTLHLVAAEDIRWMLALIAPHVIAGNARRYKQLALDVGTMARSTDILAEALQGGRERDRAELLAILEQHGISTEGQRGVYLLQRASLDGVIAQGAQRGRNATFFSLDKLPAQDRVSSREEALAELARRYFTSRGPATLQDFVWWSGLKIADARAALASIQSTLVEDMVDGQRYWRPDTSPSPPESVGALLPAFDEYLIGYRDRRAALDRDHEQALKHGGMLSPMITVRGCVAGTWKRTVTKRAAVITLNPFAPLSDGQREAVEGAAQRYGEYLRMPVELV